MDSHTKEMVSRCRVDWAFCCWSASGHTPVAIRQRSGLWTQRRHNLCAAG